MSTTSHNINILSDKYSFRRYLEIGVRDGATFCNVKMPHKTAVDPKFAFDTQSHTSEIISYFEETSDEFFEWLPERLQSKPYHMFNLNNDFKFDIVFIDGLHTFEQSYKDFRNVLKYIHDDSIIIFDDTLPSDPYSAIGNQNKSLFYRRMANIHGSPWHGDVYKTIFALHDFHPDFCYATHQCGNPQTIVWKNKTNRVRERKFKSLRNIMSMSYFDMLDNAELLVPMQFEEVVSLIGNYVDIKQFSGKLDYSTIIPAFTASK